MIGPLWPDCCVIPDRGGRHRPTYEATTLQAVPRSKPQSESDRTSKVDHIIG